MLSSDIHLTETVRVKPPAEGSILHRSGGDAAAGIILMAVPAESAVKHINACRQPRVLPKIRIGQCLGKEPRPAAEQQRIVIRHPRHAGWISETKFPLFCTCA